MSEIKLLLGNNLETLKNLEDNSIDSVVTDPPYGLSFMSKKWDYDVPSKELWTEVYRVLKPGGHLLSFGGTRTYHRLVVAIEDAGFEIRDQVMWLYGQGFPKSQDVSKQIDKQAGAEREVIGTIKKTPSAHSENMQEGWKRPWAENHPKTMDITAPATDAAKQWQGWGTALKPANEPICVARKPLEKGLTVAQNVLKWGTGALNIDACRIEGQKRSPEFKNPKSELGYHGGSANSNLVNWDNSQGRWPANVIFDEEAAKALDEQSGVSKSGKPGKRTSDGFNSNSYGKGMGIKAGQENGEYGDSGGASRFFYVAKASKSERNKGLEGMPEKEKKTLGDYVRPSEGRTAPKSGAPAANFHPTVKPIKLMEYLIKLVTPTGGTVLDPFMGSGSTGVAAQRLNINFIGCELDEQYMEISKKRIEYAKENEAVNDELEEAALEDSLRDSV